MLMERKGAKAAFPTEVPATLLFSSLLTVCVSDAVERAARVQQKATPVIFSQPP